MSWSTAQIGTILALNKDGTPKTKPIFWTPMDKKIFIPEGNQMHARPVVIIGTPDRDDTLALTLYRNQLVGLIGGKEKVLVELG